MKGATHLLIGAAAALAAMPTIDPDKPLVFVGAALIGSLLPDIDHTQSTIGRRVRGLSDLINALGGHRGATHSLLLLGFVALGGWHWAGWYGLALALGVGLHIAADMMTVSGVKLFWPLAVGSVHLLPRPLRLTTGGRIEAVLGLALLLWMIYGLSAPYHQQVVQALEALK